MSLEKSEIKMATLQSFGHKMEEVEGQRKTAMSECSGSIHALRQLYNLCETHKKQAFSEENLEKQKLTLDQASLIIKGIDIVQTFISRTVKEQEDKFVFYKGQAHALENVITMLDKEFSHEKSKAERILAYHQAQDEPDLSDERSVPRPPGVFPERKVGNPNLGQPKSDTLSDSEKTVKRKRKPKKDESSAENESKN